MRALVALLEHPELVKSLLVVSKVGCTLGMKVAGPLCAACCWQEWQLGGALRVPLLVIACACVADRRRRIEIRQLMATLASPQAILWAGGLRTQLNCRKLPSPSFPNHPRWCTCCW
jgi:hypothetical protein